MRGKIIIVNAGIVLIVGLLSYVILLTTLGDALSNPAARKLAAERATRSANAQLTLDGLNVERWLLTMAESDQATSVFSIGTPGARAEAATAQANRIAEAANKDPVFQGMQPTLVLFVDQRGIVVGRNNAALMRGDNVQNVYPSLKNALQQGRTQSAIWLNPERQEQLFASYVPVRADGGEVVGALVVGTPINDDRLARTSNLTSGDPLALALVRADGKLSMAARSGAFPSGLAESIPESAKALVNTGSFGVLAENASGHVVGAAPMGAYADGKAVLMAAVPVSLVASIGGLLWPIWGVSLLGVLMVVTGGFMIGAYISRPISQLEEGLLMVINGNTEMRFELEHEELGGLVFRINSLLNALTGVAEGDDSSE